MNIYIKMRDDTQKIPNLQKKTWKQVTLIFMIFLGLFTSKVFALGGEYTVGMRYNLNMYMMFGRVGAHPASVGVPFYPESNLGNGFDLFGEIGLTREFFLEPQFGLNFQNKSIYYAGSETNINGSSTFENNIVDIWKRSNMSFGLAVKGKTPGLRKMFRLNAVYGFQFLYAWTTERSQYETINGVSPTGAIIEGAPTQTESVSLCKDARVASQIQSRTISQQVAFASQNCDISPWGLRMFGGLGIEFYHPTLAGIVFQLDFRLGFDLTNALFHDISINEKKLNSSFFDMSGVINVAVLYRLPLGSVKKLIKKKRKKRRGNINED